MMLKNLPIAPSRYPTSYTVQSDTIYAAKEHSYEDHKRPRIRDCAA